MNKKFFTWFPWLLVMYEVAIYLSMDAYMPALPHIAQLFHVSTAAAQSTVIVWMVGALLPQLIIGPLSDRYGRRPVLLWGGLIYIVASLLCAWAPSLPIFLSGRFLQGLAMPTMYIAGYAAINEHFSSQQAIRILARMNGATILAPAFGPIFGGAFLLAFSWRWIFLLLAVLACLTLIGLLFVMPETLAAEKRSDGLHLPTLFKQYGQVCRNSVFMSGSFITFLPTIGLIAWMLAGSFIVIQHFHYSTLDFGLLQGVIFAGFIIGTKLVSLFTHVERNKNIVWIGMILAVLGSAVAVIGDRYFAAGLMFTVVSLFVATMGAGLMIPILSRKTLESATEPMGIKVTVFSLIRVFTGLVGSVCITYAYNGTLWSITGMMFVFSLIALVMWVFYKNSLMQS